MKLQEPPTGIIRTLPPCYLDGSAREGKIFARCLARMRDEDSEQLFSFALPGLPKEKFLHVYVVCAGLVRWRFNFVDFNKDPQRCIDGVTRGNFAIVCGPVVDAPREIPMRGFQGFRYTTHLW